MTPVADAVSIEEETTANPYGENPIIEALRKSGLFPLESKFAYETADQFDLNVVLPKPNELQIDIDNKTSMETFNRALPVIESRFGDVKIEKQHSKSGGEKYHITVSMEKNIMSDTERVILQACLGSDPVREILSYYRILDGETPVSMFFEKKVKAGEALA